MDRPLTEPIRCDVARQRLPNRSPDQAKSRIELEPNRNLI